MKRRKALTGLSSPLLKNPHNVFGNAANAMEKTACLKMITILSSSKRRSHSLITGQSELIEGLRLLDWIVPVVR